MGLLYAPRSTHEQATNERPCYNHLYLHTWQHNADIEWGMTWLLWTAPHAFATFLIWNTGVLKNWKPFQVILLLVDTTHSCFQGFKASTAFTDLDTEPRISLGSSPFQFGDVPLLVKSTGKAWFDTILYQGIVFELLQGLLSSNRTHSIWEGLFGWCLRAITRCRPHKGWHAFHRASLHRTFTRGTSVALFTGWHGPFRWRYQLRHMTLWFFASQQINHWCTRPRTELV